MLDCAQQIEKLSRLCNIVHSECAGTALPCGGDGGERPGEALLGGGQLQGVSDEAIARGSDVHR
jgi:hypothetical protein